ncbi:hypothetical protein [Streptomyces sp. NPDC010273]|uniref:hypothetical protein n=1 Tax=Streptomyces sp. NPDC010273 TaxID=3364829 RepID=UPI0036F0F30F
MTGAQPSLDGDELRARAHLRRLRVRPFGHQDPDVSTPQKPQPITPTRVLPAGTPLPAPLPPHPPQPGAIPPWHTAPPPPPVAVPPPPAPLEVRHVHEVVLVLPEPEETPPRLWHRLWDALVTWRMAVAVLLALLPWYGGRSPVGLWAHTVQQARTEAGIAAAYVIASVALAAAWILDRRTGRVVPRFLLVTALLGSLGVLSWWDPVQFLTGVTR